MDPSFDYHVHISDGQKAVIGNHPQVDDWAAHLRRVTANIYTEGEPTRNPNGDGAVLGRLTRGEITVVFDTEVTTPYEAQRGAQLDALDLIDSLIRPTGKITWWDRFVGEPKRIEGVRVGAMSGTEVEEGLTRRKQLQLVSGDWRILGRDRTAQLVAGSGVEVHNAGNAIAYPVFEVWGPFTQIRLDNYSTGQRVICTEPVAAGEYLRIDCQPNSRGVSRGGTAPLLHLPDFETAPLDFELRARNKDLVHWTVAGGGPQTACIVRWSNTWSS